MARRVLTASASVIASMSPMALAAMVAVAACASPASGPAPHHASDFNPREIRQPAVFVRVDVANGLDERERAALPGQYEGALLEGLNARAILPRDVATTGALDARAALARAREVGADHAVLITVTIQRRDLIFCRDHRRPFRATATVWRQEAEVLRTSDGARRLALGQETLTLSDLEADCENPRASRRRSTDETLGDAVSRLLTRLLGS